MIFALYELSLNPDIQEKLREDIQEVLKKHDGKLTYEAMLDMKYLQMVIDGKHYHENSQVSFSSFLMFSETLRKYPPVDSLIRLVANDYKIPETNLVLEKDTMVFIPVYAIHHNPEIYPEPEHFDPERFSEENKRDRHSMAFLPFGEGPRNCIGMRFGLMQTKIGLINLLTNFKFSPGPKTTIPMEFVTSAPVLCPINNMWLNMEKL